ncbi:cat eye syndrome chromosome region, candidate 1 [Quaeritorhiza haematococci]|nr:cat eye syndrome chromosome region, candidate 1 [Quaeritorhiza haematococci]
MSTTGTITEPRPILRPRAGPRHAHLILKFTLFHIICSSFISLGTGISGILANPAPVEAAVPPTDPQDPTENFTRRSFIYGSPYNQQVPFLIPLDNWPVSKPDECPASPHYHHAGSQEAITAHLDIAHEPELDLSTPSSPTLVPLVSTYLKHRDALIERDSRFHFDWEEEQRLSVEEKEVDAWLSRIRDEEVKKLKEGGMYPPMLIWGDAVQTQVNKTRTFGIMSKMPKGALLHSHAGKFGGTWEMDGSVIVSFKLICSVERNHVPSRIPTQCSFFPSCLLVIFVLDALVDVKWLVQSCVSSPFCYMHYNKTRDAYFFRYCPKPKHTLPPESICHEVLKTDSDTWVLAERARYFYPHGEEAFDDMLYNHITVAASYGDDDVRMWERFVLAFESMAGLINYLPAWKLYLEQAAETLAGDGVTYYETRMVAAVPFYDDDGVLRDFEDGVRVFEDTMLEMKERYKDVGFLGGRMIYAVVRFDSKEALTKQLEHAIRVREMFPNTIAGFDLVGFEEPGFTLMHYLEPLLANVNKIPYFFHAGETAHVDTAVDHNLYDAVLLGARRLGHAFTLAQHPYLMNIVRQRRIGVEVCPLSNQILRLVSDLRNHPLLTLLVNNVPVTISSDDPAVLRIPKPLSFDFWMVWVAFEFGLAGLKRLARNSLEYSAMPEEEKALALERWEQKWMKWVRYVKETEMTL